MNARALTTDVLLGIVPIALAIAVWQAISSFGYAPVTLLPPPGLVFQRLAEQLLTGSFQHAVAATLLRLFVGFSIAVILGVGCRACGGGQPRDQRRGAPDRARVGAVAQGGAVPGDASAGRIRP